MNTHTPTPWIACENGLARNKQGETQWTIGPSFQCLATVHRRDEGGAQMEADAKFIVRAVNSHAQLVNALEWTQKILCAYLDAETQAERDYLWKDIEHAHKTNSAALTAAQE